MIGANSSHAAGTTGGSETKTIAVGNLPSHTHIVKAHSHGLNSHKHEIGAHSHGLNNHKHSVGAHTHGLNSHTHSTYEPTAHTHTVQWSSEGVIRGTETYVVKGGITTQSANGSASTTTGAASGNTANSTAFDSGPASGSTANSTAFNSGAATGNTAATTDTDSGATGSGNALNIMPPFLSVYMWKRTA